MTAQRRSRIDPLSADVRARAARVQVWVVSWELPDRSWEALCLNEKTANDELRSRKNDSLISSWGAVQLRGPMTVESWYDGHTEHGSSDAPMYAETVQKLLSSTSDGSPVLVKTW